MSWSYFTINKYFNNFKNYLDLFVVGAIEHQLTLFFYKTTNNYYVQIIMDHTILKKEKLITRKSNKKEKMASIHAILCIFF